MQTRAGLDDDDDDIGPDFLNAVANAAGRGQAPRRLLPPAQGTPSRLTALGLGRRTPSLLDVPRTASLMFRAPEPAPVALLASPPDERVMESVHPSSPPAPPPPPPPSLEDAFLPLPAHPVLPHTLHFYAEEVPADLAALPLPQLYVVLGNLLAAHDSTLNHATFWVLDVLLEALLTAQREQLLTARGQVAFVEWFGFLLAALREHAWSREQLFAHLESAMVASVKTSASCGWRVPSPEQPAPLEGDPVEGQLEEGAFPTVAWRKDTITKPESKDGVVDDSDFDPAAAVAELGVIAKMLYATFGDGFAHAVLQSAFCAPQVTALCPLERQMQFPKTLRPPPPPPKKEKKPPPERKPEEAAKGGKSKKGGKEDKASKTGKAGKSAKSAKSEKSAKESKKGSKKGKSEKGDGDNGEKGKNGDKKGKKGKKEVVVEEVEEEPPPPENPLAKYRVEEVDWSTLEETARLNKECVCRLQEACPESFFTELFPPKPKKEVKEKVKEPKEKKGKDKGGKGKDEGGKGKDKGGKGKGKKK